MFYVNNKQVLGMFLNGKDYNYIAYGFGKIIPENRNAQLAYINLAGRNLNQYRVEYGNIQSGYDNFPIARLDYPTSGIFHSPLTYYYNGNIVPTKNVPVLITNGSYALRNALVYNDMNINGNIVYFAANSDFKGHSVNIHPENFRSNQPYFKGTVMDRCNNCNIYLNVINSNISSFRNDNSFLFKNLNNCNLNLLVNNTASFGYSFGKQLVNCNIVFDNIKLNLLNQFGWMSLYNCNITGNVESASDNHGFIEYCHGVSINLNFAKSSRVLLAYSCDNVRGNIVAGNMTNITHGNHMNLNVNNGNLILTNVSNSSFNIYNAIAQFRNVNHTVARSRTRGRVSALNNCHNISLYNFTIVGDTRIENVYDSHLIFEDGALVKRYSTWRVNNCNITGFPTTAAYTTNCRFEVGLEEAMVMNSSYITWANVWSHGSRPSSGSYGYVAGLSSVDSFMSACFMMSDDMILGGSKTFNNVINVETDIATYYNGTVTANLKNYADNIRLNVDCATLNLGVFMAGPPHGFEYSSISADNIFCTTGKDYYVYMNYGTRVYCENYCNVCFSPVWRKFSDNYQPVLLINNYKHSNTGACSFRGGITRIGRLNYQGGAAVPLELYNGACMFINNTKLGTTIVDNALLFLGSNVHFEGAKTVENGGLIVTKANYSMDAIGKFVNRNNFTWNFTDSGPWGSQSLLDYCINV